MFVAYAGGLGQHGHCPGPVGRQEMNGVVVETVPDPQRRVDVAGKLQARAVPAVGVVLATGRRCQHPQEAIRRSEAGGADEEGEKPPLAGTELLEEPGRPLRVAERNAYLGQEADAQLPGPIEVVFSYSVGN